MYDFFVVTSTVEGENIFEVFTIEEGQQINVSLITLGIDNLIAMKTNGEEINGQLILIG